MEKSINKVELRGNIGADPVVHLFENGNKVARASLATDESYKNRDGEFIKSTTWHQVTFWNKVAEKALKEVKKGTNLSIEGRLVNRQYTDKEGQTRYFTEVAVNDFKSNMKTEPQPQE
jgi:single-strand DNA-binding protein